MSSRGQIVIPQEVRERCGLKEGDEFVVVDDPSEKTVTLRKTPSREDWLSVLMECPYPLELPSRKNEFYRAKHVFSD